MNEINLAVLEAALVGAALGTPFNGLKHGHVQQLLGNPVEGFLEDGVLFPDKPERNHLPGLHGAVGQQLLAATALAAPEEPERSPVAAVGAGMLELAGDAEDETESEDMGAWRLAGRPIRRAIECWRADFPWEEADFHSRDGDSEGIAAAVPALVPMALGLDNPSDLAVRLARLTHFRLLPVASAYAVAECGRLLAEGGGKKIDGPGIVRRLVERVTAFEADYEKANYPAWKELEWGRPPARLSRAIEPVASLLREANDDLAITTIVRTAAESSPALRVTHVQHGFVAASVPWLLYRALGTLSPRVAVEDVLNRGGETAALASLLAGLMVARYGREYLPDEWYKGTRALPVAASILKDPDAEAFARWMDSERAWCAQEEALRKPLRDELRRQEKEDIATGKYADDKKKSRAREVEDQEAPKFAPPPHLWLKPGDEEDPAKKKILKEARARRRIDWKEDRRREQKKREE